MQNKINVEVVCATANKQNTMLLSLEQNSTIRDALVKFSVPDTIEELNVGIFGKLRSIDFVLQDGDRVEIYSPLLIDPKTARTQRVERERRAKRIARSQKNQTTNII